MSPSFEERSWRFALASALGRSHHHSGTPCQDASACEILSQAGADTLFAVVSDGAGSAPLSQFGARLACATVLDEARAALASGGGVGALDHEFALGALERFQHALTRVARRAGQPRRAFACTLLFAAADATRAAFAQIGDGAIVISPRHSGAREFAWVFWPQQGEYVNTTNFASEADAAQKLQFEARAQRIDELSLFSDGLQGLVLDARRRVAHAGFFEPMFTTLRRSPGGRAEVLCASLARYLGSRAVAARTDDDTSLVLATRRAAEPRPALPQPALTSALPTASAPLPTASAPLNTELRD